MPLNISRGGLYVALGDFSVTAPNSDQPKAAEVQWFADELIMSELKMTFKLNDSESMDAAKGELSDLMKSNHDLHWSSVKPTTQL